jgi:hypothetical protein
MDDLFKEFAPTGRPSMIAKLGAAKTIVIKRSKKEGRDAARPYRS